MTVTAQTCPPAGFDSLEPFDLDAYISHRWYSIKQVPVIYQPLTQFYCVYAEYTLITRKSLWCRVFRCTDPPTIRVYNSARRRSVTGRVNSITLQGTITGTSQSKALVGFPIVSGPPPLRRGSNYWVVKAGKWSDLPSVSSPPVSDDVYDWAIITTGQPKSVGSDGKCYSNGGMWIFSSLNVPPANAVTDIEAKASELGLSITEWKTVQQDGCQY